MFQQGVPRGDGHAKVAALDDQADVGQALAHAGEGGVVVAEEVGAREGGRDLEGLAGLEGGVGGGGQGGGGLCGGLGGG